MSVSSSLLRVPIEVPNRSGHNCSHSNSFTGTTGTLVPVMCKDMLPGDKVSVGCQFQVQLPPMVTDFYGRVDFVYEAFFVPYRLLWAGWKNFITHPTANPIYPENTPVASRPTIVPLLSSTDEEPVSVGVDNLLHYLDYGRLMDYSKTNYSALPVIAYHRIYDDWYRDTRVQAPVFYEPVSTSISGGYTVPIGNIPYLSRPANGSGYDIDVDSYCSDGVRVTDMRQRNWVKDYFTSASPLPQAGNASEVKFDISTATESGAFSISTLRAANSLQKWMERNNLAGYRYSDQIYAQFGVYPADAVMDRCLYLGRHVDTVYNRSVFSTVSQGDSLPLGSKASNSQVLGEGSLIDNFEASEHGFLMVLASLVPRPVYGTGADRNTRRVTVGDFAFPLLAGMGDQAIKGYEITGRGDQDYDFGYTDLYADYKFYNDTIHGLLLDGQSLDKFALQRGFQPGTTISSDFLKIPKSYLDQVQAVRTSVSGYSYWATVHFPFKKISTIPAYSQPTLADLEHAHTEYISRGGKRL